MHVSDVKVQDTVELVRVPLADPGGTVDLRDLSGPLLETCAALSLSLREGDLVAAERLFGFVVDQIPDRRLALTDVFQPLVAQELDDGSPEDVRLFTRTCHDLLVRLRRPTVGDDAGALLVTDTTDRDVLTAHMLALLLDDAGIPVFIVDLDEEVIGRRVRMGRETVACVIATERSTSELTAAAIKTLRPLRAIQLEPYPSLDEGSHDERGADRLAATLGEAVDLLLHLRGPLTPAEAVALRLAADGYTNFRISRELGVSLSAIKARLEGIYTKLHAADRTHAVAIALRERWIR